MNEVAIRHGSALTLTPDQEWWSEKQLAALRQLGVQDATNGDLAVFFHTAQRTGLDPFARQIYMIKRKGKQTIQTGIDGFRLVARRAADRNYETIAYEDTLWADADGNWHDVWLEDHPPTAAKVVVLRGGHRYPGIALWREYVQFDSNGQVNSMWTQRPAGQLAKCAEALALRRACPHDLAGIHTADELRDDPPRQEPTRRVTGAEILGKEDAAEAVEQPESDTITGEVDWPEVKQPPEPT